MSLRMMFGVESAIRMMGVFQVLPPSVEVAAATALAVSPAANEMETL